MINEEDIILKSLPVNINFISRDEDGELWVTEHRPEISDGSKGLFLSFSPETTLTNLYSFAVYNHLFNELGNLSVLEIGA